MKNILFNTKCLQIVYEYEDAFLIDENQNILMQDSFYGDPTCGLIANDNSWAIMAGEHITVWKKDHKEIMINHDLKWIHELRVKDVMLIEILIDPWSDTSAIWELDLKEMLYRKIKIFDKYKNSPYTEVILW